jgi:phosphoglycerate dehydrogenase-like enzyme
MTDVIRHRLYVDRPLPPDAAELVIERCEICGPEPEAMADAVGIIASGVRWDAARLDRVPGARVLSRSGIGHDNIDVAAATARGIVVCVAAAAPTVSTAEHAIALMLAAAKRLVPNQLRLRAGRGEYFMANDGVELAGRTLGLIGYGRIARRVHRAAAALEMNVVACDPYLTIPTVDVDLVSFAELLACADVVSLHVPLLDTTRHIINASAFDAMRPGVIFINTARGGLVDHDALLEALGTGKVSAAGLDVTDPEPLPSDHPLLLRDDVIITPHIASATVDGKLRLSAHAIDNALAVLNGGVPRWVVNPEVVERR